MTTYNSNQLPTTTGLSLGNANQRWNAYLQNLYIPTITLINAGVFNNNQQNLYFQSLLGGIDPSLEWGTIFTPPSKATEAITGGILIPSGGTVFQSNAVSAYINNANGAVTAGVALFGMANGNSANARIWGINTVAMDSPGNPSQSIYAAEFDANLVNASSVTHGILITGFWYAQPATSMAIEVGPVQGSGGATYYWPYGIRFDTGATTSPTANNAAVFFFPVGASTNKPSQGMSFLANGSVGTLDKLCTMNLLASGIFDIEVVQGGMQVNGLTQGIKALAGTTSFLVPTITNVGLLGDTGNTLGSGTGKNYGVIGTAKAVGDALGDRAYGGWFKANATTNPSSEVGIHAEVNDASTVAAIAEFWAAGAQKAVIDGIGNLTANNVTGSNFTGAGLSLTSKIGVYNNLTLVNNGVPSEVAGVAGVAQTAAITTATLYAVSAIGAGPYRLSWNAKITTAASTGAATSSLGPLTIVYTDPDGVAITLTAGAMIAAGTIATSSAANTTGTVLIGIPLLLNCKASTNVTFAFAYASNTAAQMVFNINLILESM